MSTTVSITSGSTNASNASAMASCDQSEKQNKNSVSLSGGSFFLPKSQSDAIFKTLLDVGIVKSDALNPIQLTANGQTYFVVQTSTGEQMYRAATADLLTGSATLIPLASIMGPLDWEYPHLSIEAYATDTLIYVLREPPSYVLQAINPQAGQSLWSLSASSDFSNVDVSGDGVFFDTLDNPAITKLDLSTGKVLWQSNVGELPSILDDGHFAYTIVTGPATSTLYQLSNDTGQVIKQFPFPDPFSYQSIDECGGNLYLSREGGGESGPPIISYGRFDPKTGIVTDLGYVTGPAY
jgi:outer membrane protein assembly factor BamB